jgi:hypothetical protein
MPVSPKDLKSQTICWRDHLAVHPAAEAYPLLSEKELKQLAGDIQRNDLRTDFVLWRPDDKTEPALLDGRNRLDALALIDRLTVDQGELCIKQIDGSLQQIKNCRTITGGDPQKHADSFNLWRRHLKPEEKRDLIARWIKTNPEKSNNAIAKETKIATDKTVAAVRAELEATSEIPKLEKTVGADGKTRARPTTLEAAGDVSQSDTRKDAKGRKQPVRKPPRRPAKKKREIICERQALVRRLVAGDPELVILLSKFFGKYPDRIDAFFADVSISATEIEELDRESADAPEASAEAMKAKFSAIDDGSDAGPLPEILRRDRVQP